MCVCTYPCCFAKPAAVASALSVDMHTTSIFTRCLSADVPETSLSTRCLSVDMHNTSIFTRFVSVDMHKPSIFTRFLSAAMAGKPRQQISQVAGGPVAKRPVAASANLAGS